MLRVIPVIDLLAGEVVHARRGDRANYRAVQSVLCRGAQPEAVLGGLLTLAPFSTVYCADLDAIQGRGDHRATLRRLRAAFPEVEFWVDAGLHDADSLRRWHDEDLGRPIVGAESLPDVLALDAIAEVLRQEQWILSLDYRGDEFLGPPDLWRRVDHWPADLIAMNLAKVGSSEGPDTALLRRLVNMGQGRRVHAAGGVRDPRDLHAAAEAGASGALVATALHDGRIGAAELRIFATAWNEGTHP